MANASNVVVVLLCLLTAGGLSCQRRSARPVRLAGEKKGQFAPAAWGTATDGLQCRLRPAKRLWPVGERPAFRVDLRNEGQRVFALAVEPLQPQRVAIDRRWQPWSVDAATGRKMAPLSPGGEFTDLSLVLPPETLPRLTSGLHRVEVAFVFEGIEVPSNSVEIEIVN